MMMAIKMMIIIMMSKVPEKNLRSHSLNILGVQLIFCFYIPNNNL